MTNLNGTRSLAADRPPNTLPPHLAQPTHAARGVAWSAQTGWVRDRSMRGDPVEAVRARVRADHELRSEVRARSTLPETAFGDAATDGLAAPGRGTHGTLRKYGDRVAVPGAGIHVPRHAPSDQPAETFTVGGAADERALRVRERARSTQRAITGIDGGEDGSVMVPRRPKSVGNAGAAPSGLLERTRDRHWMPGIGIHVPREPMDERGGRVSEALERSMPGARGDPVARELEERRGTAARTEAVRQALEELVYERPSPGPLLQTRVPTRLADPTPARLERAGYRDTAAPPGYGGHVPLRLHEQDYAVYMPSRAPPGADGLGPPLPGYTGHVAGARQMAQRTFGTAALISGAMRTASSERSVRAPPPDVHEPSAALLQATRAVTAQAGGARRERETLRSNALLPLYRDTESMPGYGGHRPQRAHEPPGEVPRDVAAQRISGEKRVEAPVDHPSASNAPVRGYTDVAWVPGYTGFRPRFLDD